MARIINGKIAYEVNPPELINRLVTTGVVRSKSGVDDWVIIDSPELLDLYMADATNYESYKLMVNAGVTLMLRKQFNSSDHPYYKLRINNNANIHESYPISGVEYANPESNRLPTQQGVGDLVMFEGYTMNYHLKLRTDEHGNQYLFHDGDYFAIPLAHPDRAGHYLMVYMGTNKVIQNNAELFNYQLKISSSMSVSDQMDLIVEKLSAIYNEEGIPTIYDYKLEKKEDEIIITYIDKAFKYESFHNLGEAFYVDKEFDYDTLVNAVNDDALVEFTSKFRGSRGNKLEIILNKIKYSNDYDITIIMDNYIEKFTVEFYGGTDHFVEDVLMDSRVVNCEVINRSYFENQSADISGSYKFIRPQSDLPITEQCMEDAWYYEDDQGNQVCSIDDNEILHYLFIDDGLGSLNYDNFIKPLVDEFGAFYLSSSNQNQVAYHNVLKFPQKLTAIDGKDIIIYTPTILKIYDNSYLGEITKYLIEESNLSRSVFNIYDLTDYIIDINYLINTAGEEVIEDLIVKGFSKRLEHRLTYIFSKDDGLNQAVDAQISSVLSISPMIEYAKLMSCERIKLNTLKIKINLKVKKYSTGTIILNFTIKL